MSKDYKDTLQMPKTEFPMRGNLPTKEPEMQKEWNKKKIYEQVLEKNKNNTPYILHDGPPYANGDIHIGHALDKILKDFVVRYKLMQGHYSPYIPGWDTHGLPIETALAKNKKINRKEHTVSEFRKMCADYAMEQVEKQKEQFKRLGNIGEWDNPYITLQPEYEYHQIKVFAKMVGQGLIYKGVKPVYWSPSSETALAEAEIEYHDKQSPSIFVGFKVVEGNEHVEAGAEIVIWTTTPWTLPANLAVAVGEDFDYALVRTSAGKTYIIASKLVSELMEKEFEISDYEIVKVLKGSEVAGIKYKHPLCERTSPVLIGHHVTLESGTGCVHIAPGHGEDDFIIGKKFGLDVLCPVDEKGHLTEEAGEFAGLYYDKANKSIGEKLEECGALLSLKIITHSYPHDWRTKKPIIFRVTPQWFASIAGLKEKMIKEIGNVNWYPKWGEKRLINMIKDRDDWCISRQRVWGVPIPIFYTEKGNEILDSNVIEHVADLFKEKGSNVWFELEAKELLPKGYTHPDSPNGLFTKETDIMDVWFDSGTSHMGVLKNRGIGYPADLYLEGSDQYRGWFNSSLSTGVAMTGKSPYKTLVTHGFVVDEKGLKMSKSTGNVVDPLKIMKQYGADILRMWVSSVDYQSDVRISENLIKQVAESYRKIRNTFRFILSNLYDFDIKKDAVKYEDMKSVDKYMMIRLSEVVSDIKEAYSHFEFDKVYRIVTNYVVNELSSFYLDFTKDILYIEQADGIKRRTIQTVFYKQLTELLFVLAPIIPHTAEEVYTHIPNIEHKDSILLEEITVLDKCTNTEDIKSNVDMLLNVRESVLKALELARADKLIGKSLEASLEISLNEDFYKAFNKSDFDFKTIFIVSNCKITKDKLDEVTFDNGDIQVKVSKALGTTCPRCWQVVEEVTNDEICERCHKVVK